MASVDLCDVGLMDIAALYISNKILATQKSATVLVLAKIGLNHGTYGKMKMRS